MNSNYYDRKPFIAALLQYGILCCSVLMCASVLFIPSRLQAQKIIDLSDLLRKRWSISVDYGFVSGGPANSIMSNMSREGFIDPTPGGYEGYELVPGKKTPYSESDFGFWAIAVHYLNKYPYGIGLSISNTDVGSVTGYRVSDGLLEIQNSVLTVASVVSYQKGWFRFSTGPALHYVEWKTDGGNTTEQKIGLLSEIALIYTDKSLFFAQLKIQHRYVGNVNVGPVSVGEYEFPASDAPFNHFYWALGWGFRL